MDPILVGILLAFLVPLFWVVATFNRFARLKNLVRESWADIDVQLKRRYDLIPNLVETVKGYAAYERSVLEEITKAREDAMRNMQNMAAQVHAQSQLVHGLNLLLAKAEAYPELKANQNYLSLQVELASTEDRIAAARRFYNANVRELNTAVNSFPSALLAGMAGAQEQPFFEVESLQVRAPVAVHL